MLTSMIRGEMYLPNSQLPDKYMQFIKYLWSLILPLDPRLVPKLGQGIGRESSPWDEGKAGNEAGQSCHTRA